MEGETNRNAVYRECLRNHAASLGSYATDGCGEFTLDDNSQGELQCAACGCHRNFHRKMACPTSRVQGRIGFNSRGREMGISTTHHELIDYGCGGESGSEGRVPNNMAESGELDRSGKKRFRTKFTADQKEKMLAFAEKLGWKLLRKDLEDEIERFCRDIGVSRQVFKVWMHNHKNSSSSSSASIGNASSLTQ